MSLTGETVRLLLFPAYVFLNNAPALESIRAAGSSGRGHLPHDDAGRKSTSVSPYAIFIRNQPATFAPLLPA